MNQKLADTFCLALDNAGWKNDTREYSGRGMLGGKTTGVVTNASLEAVLTATLYDSRLFANLDIPHLRTDNIGHNIVIY